MSIEAKQAPIFFPKVKLTQNKIRVFRQILIFAKN